jgi:MFS family permease
MMQRHGRNTAFLAMVEAFWGLGMNVVSVGTVIPVFLERLGASNAVIALLPSLSALGAGIPMLASSFLTRRSRRMKRWVLGLHLVAPLPLGVIAAGLHAGVHSPILLVLVCWGVYYGLLGLLFPMWMDYMARILDPARRGRAIGFVFLVQTLSGVSGVSLAAWLLKGDSGTSTYSLLFALSWAAGVGGSLFFLGTREDVSDRVPERLTARQHLGKLLGMVLKSRPLLGYTAARCLVRGTYPLLVNFYAAHAVAKRGVSVSEAALYGAAALVCQAGASWGLGYLGDRTGHRLPVLLGQGALLAGCVLVLLPLPAAALFAVAALTGVYMGTEYTSQNNWIMDLAPAGERQSAISVVGFLMTPAAVLVPLVGGGLMDRLGFPAVCGGVALVVLGVMTLERTFVPPKG